LVGGINTATPTQASAVDGQIGHIQAQILNIVNHDSTLAKMAVGADGTTGFVALPPGTAAGHGDAVASNGPQPGPATGGPGDVGAPAGHDVGQPGHGDVGALPAQHFDHIWG
jgi:hypothetical protein